MSRDRTYDFLYAAEATEVLHAPMKALETFGTTCVDYHLLAELEDYPGKIRVREGRLQASKPELITPEQYVKDEFEGFGEMAKLYYDFLKQLMDWLKPEYIGRLCVARAQEKQWDVVGDFISAADQKSVEQLMELAIAEGNFDAVDLVNPHL